MSGSVSIAALTFDDLSATQAYELWRLRQNVFILEQTSIYPDLDGRDLEDSTRHVLAYADGVLVGCARVVNDGDHRRVGRVVVAPAARGSGLAGRIMEAALAECGDHEVWLDAQTQLRAFYAGFGFEVMGPEFDDGGIPHVPMTRTAQTTE